MWQLFISRKLKLFQTSFCVRWVQHVTSPSSWSSFTSNSALTTCSFQDVCYLVVNLLLTFELYGNWYHTGNYEPIFFRIQPVLWIWLVFITHCQASITEFLSQIFWMYFSCLHEQARMARRSNNIERFLPIYSTAYEVKKSSC